MIYHNLNTVLGEQGEFASRYYGHDL